MAALYDSGLDADDPLIHPRKELKVGSVVKYRLLPQHRPTNPRREWRGRVVLLVGDGDVGIMVESLEEGYEGLWEFVETRQLLSVE